MYTFRNGDKRSGDWDSGTLRTPLPPADPSVQRAVQVNNNFPVHIYQTKIYPLQFLWLFYCPFIQASQRAAENAFRLPRVDEQVHKVVMAANREATAARVAAIKAVQNRMDGKFCDTYV